MLLVAVWGVSWPVMKIGLREVPPIWFGALRYLIAASLLFGLLSLKRRVVFPARQDWPLILVSGLFQMAAFSALTGLALKILPPGRASVLAYSTPLWVVPIAAWQLEETVSRPALAGVASGLVGILVIAAPAISGRDSSLVSYVMLLAASACWAFAIVYNRAHRFAGSSLALAPWQSLLSALVLLPAAFIVEGPLKSIGPIGALSLAYVGPVATAFAYWAVVETGRHFRAGTISVALLATPVVGIAVSAVITGEAIDLPLVAGTVLVAAGIGLVARQARHHSAGGRLPFRVEDPDRYQRTRF